MRKFCRYTLYFWGIVVFCISSSFYQPKPNGLAGERIIIKFKEQPSDTNRNEAPLTQLHLQKRAAIEDLRLEVWQLPNEETIRRNTAFQDISDYIDYLTALPEVEYAEPDYLVTTTETIPNDPEFSQQWALKNTGQNGCIVNNSIRATSAWDIQTKCDSLPIGIIDTGIDWTHPDLIENIWQNLGEDADGDSATIEWNGTQWILDPGDLLEENDDDSNGYVNDLIGWDFVNDDNNPMDDDGHGTHVAGIIGARGNNGIGISGVCWEAKLMALKGLNHQGTGYVSELIQAIDYSVKMGVKISNNSWSVARQYNQALFEAIERAQEADQLFVTAAGNNGTDNDVFPVYPASFQLSNIFTVGASDCQNRLPAFANYGEKSVDIMAPGDGIYSTQLNEEYGFRSGSSMAAPFVTGAAAIMANKYPYSSGRQLKEMIMFHHTSVENFSEKCISQGSLNIHSLLFSEPNINSESEVWINFSSANARLTSATETYDAIWLGTESGGLIRIDKIDSTQKVFNSANSPLPSNEIRHVLADQNGDLWITFRLVEYGIVKFDGTNLTMYNQRNSGLASGFITEFAFDKSGTLWLATLHGLCKFDGTNWFTYNRENSTISGIVEELAIDKSQNIWFHADSGLTRFDGNNFTIFNEENSPIPNNRIDDIAVDSSNNVWIGTGGNLAKFNGTDWEIFTPTNSNLPDTTVSSLIVNEEGELWIGSYFNIIKYYEGHWEIFELTQADVTDVSLLLIDHTFQLWLSLSTPSGGKNYILDNGTWINDPLVRDGIGGYSAGTVTIDKYGNIWVGSTPYSHTKSWGVSKYDGNEWIHYNAANSGLANDSIWHMTADTVGNIWIGTRRGLSLYDVNGNWTTYNPTNSGLRGWNIYSVFVDSQQRIWAFTDTSLNSSWVRFDGNNWTPFPLNNDFLTEDYFFQIAEDSQGNFWFGMVEGLSQLLPDGTWKTYNTFNSGLPDNYVRLVAIDQEDNIWVATHGGLVKFDGENWHTYDLDNSALTTSQGFTGLAIDSKNNIWISTYYGLFKLDGRSWTQYYGSNSGLSANGIYGMTIDHEDNIWLGTNSGLVFLNTSSSIAFSLPRFTTCLGQSIIYNNTSDTENIRSFQWLINDLPVSTDTNLVYTFEDPGVYKITLLAYDTVAGDRSFSQFITAQVPISVDLGPDTTACAERIYLDVGIANSIYLWQNTFSDTLSETQGLIIDSSGIYTVAVTDACGFTAHDTIIVNLTDDPLGSCVWPGDVNADGWVNLIDFLVLGAENGLTGTNRPDSSLAFTSQPSKDWDIEMNHAAALGIDAKHADCNGDGRIDILTDAAAIFANAQGSHRTTVNSAAAQNRLRIRPQQTRYNLGDIITYNVYLDNAQSGIVPEAYGLAFSMQHNLQLSQFPELDTEDSWLGTSREDMTEGIIKYPYHFDVGITRFIQTPKSDSGKIAKVSLTILAEDIDTSKYVNKIFFTMKSLNALLMQQSGEELAINSLTTNTMETITLDIPRIDLDLSIWLQGAYRENEALMSTNLRRQNLLPKEHPYGKIYQPKPDSIPPNVVDWIVVELRYPEDTSKVVSQRAAWLLDDGRIVDPQDGGPLSMVGTTGFYFISIRHRNHLTIMSANTLLLTSGQLTQYDFSHQEQAAFGTNSTIQLSNGKWAMYAGDINQDKQIAYSGYENDRAKILSRIGVSNPTAVTRGYWPEDLNLDGLVKYSGSKNDRQLIIRNIGIEDLTRKIISEVP